ncbi:MAG: TonB-dependent receptor plug domain-containing protein [Odoribacter splanchnicus]
MKEDVQAIDEVVVTGYFNKAKTSYTGSAVSVKGEDLKKISPTNLFKALQAYEPSFQIVENKEAGADPNHVPDILIRGKSSFEGKSNNPLFIMDGYEVSLQTIFDTDMERISQVTILKDAAATAIYGSRAANGVIVIETKMPAQGKLSVSYSFNGTVEYPDLTDYDLLNAGEKLEFERLAGVYKNEDLKKQMDLDRLYEERKREVLRGVNTYWLSKLQTAFKHTIPFFWVEERTFTLWGKYQLRSESGHYERIQRDRLGLSFTRHIASVIKSDRQYAFRQSNQIV